MSQVLTEGSGSLSRIAELASRYNASSVFLVTGKASYRGCGAEAVLDSVLADKRVVRFCDFTPNPQLRDVENGVSIFRESDCDLMIAVGGGSVLDIAKLINICAASETARASCADLITKRAQPTATRVPLIAVPTTAGTGAESTHFSTVYIGDAKYSMAHPSMLPQVVILDPTLTASLPAAVTAATGIDALAQALESFWSVGATAESRGHALAALPLVTGNLELAVNHPSERAREMMLRGANLAGQAINISKTTAPHALSYAFTARYGIPHGHAVGLTLGAMFEYNACATAETTIDPRGLNHVHSSMEQLAKSLGVAVPSQGRARLGELMNAIGLTTSLSTLGVPRADLESIARSVNLERLANNPRSMSTDDVGSILESVFQ